MASTVVGAQPVPLPELQQMRPAAGKEGLLPPDPPPLQEPGAFPVALQLVSPAPSSPCL